MRISFKIVIGSAFEKKYMILYLCFIFHSYHGDCDTMTLNDCGVVFICELVLNLNEKPTIILCISPFRKINLRIFIKVKFTFIPPAREIGITICTVYVYDSDI